MFLLMLGALGEAGVVEMTNFCSPPQSDRSVSSQSVHHEGATRLHHVTVMIFISIAATLQRMLGLVVVQSRTAVQIDDDSATAQSGSCDEDRSVLWNICDFHRLR